MYYKEFLRVGRFFSVFAICIFAIAVLVVLLSGHAKVNVSDASPHAYALAAQDVSSDGDHAESGSTNIYAPGIDISNEPNEPSPFSAILAAAGLVAAIFATGIGTVLACENHGHLEIAWTRPTSRVAC